MEKVSALQDKEKEDTGLTDSYVRFHLPLITIEVDSSSREEVN